MVTLRVDIETHRVQPGDEVRGVVSWEADEPIHHIEIRMAWQTEGKGSPSTGVAHQDRLESPPLRGSQAFSFDAPEAPYSFSGKLVSLGWGIGARSFPQGEFWRTFVLSPTGREIVLHAGDREVEP